MITPTQTIVFNMSPIQLEELISNAVKKEMAASKPIQDQEIYHTRKQTTKRLNITLPTLNEYTKRGIIMGCRIGSRILYSETAIQNALKEIPNRHRANEAKKKL